MIAKLIVWSYDYGFELTLGEALRTEEQQEIYLKNGKSKAKRSKHQDKLAIDLHLFVNNNYIPNGDAYRRIGEEWEKMGGRWGGRFGVKPENYANEIGWDSNHFEYRD